MLMSHFTFFQPRDIPRLIFTTIRLHLKVSVLIYGFNCYGV
jgi:hypothetical protein